jgi:hypothetical protein
MGIMPMEEHGPAIPTGANFSTTAVRRKEDNSIYRRES